MPNILSRVQLSGVREWLHCGVAGWGDGRLKPKRRSAWSGRNRVKSLRRRWRSA